MKILLAMRGFEEPEKNGIVERLTAEGADIEEVYVAHTKMGVLQVCNEHTDIDAAIVSQYLESGSPYTPEDIDKIDEIRESLRVVPILINECYGKNYVERLHNLAIYNAIFEQDASMAVVADIIKNGRNKKVAKLYYGIQKEAVMENTSGISDPEELLNAINHVIRGGVRQEAMKRLKFVETQRTSAEFTKLLSRLPQEYLEEARESGWFGDYFVTEDIGTELGEEVIKKEQAKEKAKVKEKKEAESVFKIPSITFRKGRDVNIPIPVPSFSSGRKALTVIENRTTIGILSLERAAGSTFVAMNMARCMATDNIHIPVLVQPPATHDALSEVYAKNEAFMRKYRSFYDWLEPQENVDEDANMVDGVRLILDMKEEGKSEKWSYVKVVKMLNAVGNPGILDFGCEYEKFFYLNTLKDCSVVVVVLDGRKEPDTDEIRKVKELVEKSGIEQLIFVINRYNEEQREYFETYISDMYQMVFIPEYSSKQQNEGLLAGIASNSSFTKLCMDCGFEVRRPKKMKKLERPVLKQKVVTNGTMEIGFCGVQRGAGATYTAILCACSLAAAYRVAYIELNDHEHMTKMVSALGGDSPNSGKVNYKGIDIYYGIDYLQFITNYRNEYDYVIADFGILDGLDTIKRNEFIRMNKRIVVSNGNIWNMGELEKFFEEMAAETEEVVYVIPFGDKEVCKDIRKLCCGIEVFEAGYNVCPFEPRPEQMRLFQSVVGMREKEQTQKKGFWKRALSRQ